MGVGSKCQGFSMNKHGWHHCNCPENVSKHCIRPAVFELGTGARTSVASCLNTIGSQVACFRRLLANGFASATHCHEKLVWGAANPLAKTVLVPSWNAATDGHHTLASIAVGFVEVQPGFLQLILTQT